MLRAPPEAPGAAGLRPGKERHTATTVTERSILNEDGSCPEQFAGLVPDEDLLALLRTIVLNRELDRRMMLLQRQGRLGFYIGSTGEEAVTVGSAYALRADDPIFLSYREMGSLLWRGVPLETILNQLIGNSQDLSKGRQMPIHHCYREYAIPPVSAPVGTQLPHAAGFGYAMRLQGRDTVALAFCGEGTTAQGDFHTALNFAAVLNAQAVFVIRNNGYAISTPESLQTRASSLAGRASGYGMPGAQIDGNDLLMVIHTVRQAVERARAGAGPTLIEALTYRLGAHSSSDDPTRYRSAEELRQWERVDALVRLKRHAAWRGLWTEELDRQAVEQANRRIDEAVASCERWPPPPLDSLFDDVYETMPEHLRRQKEELLAFLRARGGRAGSKRKAG